MKAGKIILKWALILVLAFTTFNWFISPDYKVERSVEIDVPTYIVYDNKNKPSLSELELIEPELWFRNCPKSAELLAMEIEKLLC